MDIGEMLRITMTLLLCIFLALASYTVAAFRYIATRQDVEAPVVAMLDTPVATGNPAGSGWLRVARVFLFSKATTGNRPPDSAVRFH